MAARLEIRPAYKGMGVYTHKPETYERKEEGKFILEDSLSQKDRRYLYDVMGLKIYFLEVEDEAPKKNKKHPLAS